MPRQTTPRTTLAETPEDTTVVNPEGFAEVLGVESDPPPFDTPAVTDAARKARKTRRAAINAANDAYKTAVASHRAAIAAAQKTRDAALRQCEFEFMMASDPDSMAAMAAMFESWKASQSGDAEDAALAAKAADAEDNDTASE